MTSFKNTLFSLLALLLPLSIDAEVKPKKKKPVNAATGLQIKTTSPFYAVSHEYMKGYVTESLEDNEEDLKAFEKKLRLAIPQIPTYTQYAKVYSLFSAVNVPGSSVFNKNSWDDLELLVGEHNQATNLMNFVDRTTTSFGKIYLSYMVATPIANVTVLKKRQAIINEFATNKKLSTNISKLLTKAKAAENNFFFLWQEETDFNFKAINSYFFSSSLPGFKKLRHANTNPYIMELLCFKGRLVSAGIGLSVPLLMYAVTRGFYGIAENAMGKEKYRDSEKPEILRKKLAESLAKKTEHLTPTEAIAYFENLDIEGALEKSIEETSYLTQASLWIDKKIHGIEKNEQFINSRWTPAFIVSYPQISTKLAKKLDLEELIPSIQNDAAYYQSMLHPTKKALNQVVGIHTPWARHLAQSPTDPKLCIDPKDSTKSVDVESALTAIKNPSMITWGDLLVANKVISAEYETNNIKYFYGATAAGLGLEGLTMLAAYNRENNYNKLTTYLHVQMMAAGTILQSMQTLNAVIKNNATLSHSLEHSQNLSALFAKTDVSVSPKLHKLAQLLTTSTFKGQPSYFTLKGRVLAAYALMKEIKDELAPALVALGEVDALLSCAKLLEEGSNEPNHYTFATYIEQDTPFICMTNMWNPFVGPKKSVVNSIELGGKNPRNVILTGPNAGGKSTFSKGLTLNVVLAQTVGIVPAQSLTLTVFDKINTYMNITDDTAGGNSLFKSEVLRAQELLKTITGLDKAKFSFSVMDEMFSGTSPQEGQAASYAVAKNIGSQPNSIAVIATHFPRLKKLDEETTYFKNYQVRVVRHDNGTFSYPFKLEAGAADQNVAIDILQQQGFDMSILSDAHAILNETPANK